MISPPYPLDNPHFVDRLCDPRVHQEPLIRAVYGRKPTLNAPLRVWDMTAGWGLDALLCAAAGATVDLWEREAQICNHLRQLLQYLHASPPPFAHWGQRMQWHEEDSGAAARAAMHTRTLPRPDVAYLDPMFSHRSSALPKKAMAALRAQLPVPSDAECGQLLHAARLVALQRVVVKRYKSHAPLNKLIPHHTVGNRRVRYDVYYPLPNEANP